jgi:L-alanine-DL-glutamate epimerase-like enolase superfamily enzyme
MRIASIELFHATYKLHDEKYAWSGGHAVEQFLTNIVRVTTDDGVTGYGEVCPLGSGYMDAHALGVAGGLQTLGPALLGKDPTDLRALNDVMDQTLGGHAYVKSPIDIACWDIFGQAANAPICTLLGGRRVDRYPLYRAISQDTPDKMAASVARYRAEGYRKFQLKSGSAPEEDIARIKASRKVLADDDVLVADANTGWRQHEAIRVANGVREVNVYIEQPCVTLEECLAVRANTDLPMVLDEVITGVVPLLRARDAGAMDVVNIKISRVGGLTKAKLLRDLCEASGIVMTIEDSWGGDVATTAIAHLAGSTRADFLFSSTDFNSYVDLSVAPDAPRRKDGWLAVPSAPGLGIHVEAGALDPAVLKIA